MDMTTITPMLSEYGVTYTIIGALVVCVIHLYKRTNALEKELRDVIMKFHQERSNSDKEVQAKYAEQNRILTATLNENSAVLKSNTEVMKDIRALFREQALLHQAGVAVSVQPSATIPPQ